MNHDFQRSEGFMFSVRNFYHFSSCSRYFLCYDDLFLFQEIVS